ncbi:MAG: hypothetical protein JJU36_02535 [Phycisphaeraceae bacterium]|nr:hypothetical protein [Phycisphaeraceae bacterium]
MPGFTKRRWTTILIILLLSHTPLAACLWDYDTLRQEAMRFPSALALITGNFNRHSEALYRWRIEDRKARLAEKPDDLALMDDLAAAYDKIGEPGRAVELMRRSLELAPQRYETHANLGTVLLHNGQLEEGLGFIRSAIEINPDAHFGREIYQQRLVEWLMSRSVEGEFTLPLRHSHRDQSDTPWYSQYSFARFLEENHFEGGGMSEEDRQEAIRGVLGMMRFGRHDSPILLEALGDLLTATHQTSDAKQLAARAYLKASYVVEGSEARQAYREMASAALEGQSRSRLLGHDSILLDQVEFELAAELRAGEAHFQKIIDDQERWIAEGKNPEAEFYLKYDHEPEFLPDEEEGRLAKVVGFIGRAGVFLFIAAFALVGALWLIGRLKGDGSTDSSDDPNAPW